ncbi:hypothetical protein NKR19_g6779 [Coniochaeta hoffmannii]|uniref:Uncharacterized protein n=1 Tax=Coniochaeta hoffmannii TaxID=91930 RepID=A0AA38VP82_9PEZI|nr:hypothetical protein NKR19_g6779 [Coniochaeta hoffmannii]
MADEERLAAMFTKNMSLDPVTVPQQPARIVYVSQHYTHTAHIAAQPVEAPQTSPRPASEPPQSEHLLAETVLRNHGVDPSCLSASQVQLFKTADEPQQLRLIELWRIYPPTNSNNNSTLAWTSLSTLEQEIVLARDRYTRAQMQPAPQDDSMMSLDGTPLVPLQDGDGRWMSVAETDHYMEPYMSTGYAGQAPDVPRVAAYKPSTDPVYSGTCTVNYSQLEKMENQYGRMMDI